MNSENDVEIPWIVHMIIEDANEPDSPTRGWVHTHGLCHLGLPELEVRDVNPSFLMWDAGMLLNRIGKYMMRTGKIVKAGEVMAFGEANGQAVRFHVSVPIEGDEEHFQVERLEVTGVDMMCSCCAEEAEANEEAN